MSPLLSTAQHINKGRKLLASTSAQRLTLSHNLTSTSGIVTLSRETPAREYITSTPNLKVREKAEQQNTSSCSYAASCGPTRTCLQGRSGNVAVPSTSEKHSSMSLAGNTVGPAAAMSSCFHPKHPYAASCVGLYRTDIHEKHGNGAALTASRNSAASGSTA